MSTSSTDVFERLAQDAESEPDDSVVTETTDDDAVSDTPAPVEAGRSTWRRQAAMILIGLALAATSATAGYSQWRLHDINATTAAGQAALAAARDYAVALTTLDAKDIDHNYALALDGATGNFKSAFSLGSAQLRQMLIDNKATGKGVVVDAAVKSATRTKVQVLLFVDQSITNAVRDKPRIDRNRIQMTMELVDNRWLASQVELA